MGSQGVNMAPAARSEEFLRRAAARLLQDQQRDAAPDEAGRQRHHHVGHARQHDDQAVHRAQDRAGEEDRQGEQQRLAEARVLHRAARRARWRPPSPSRSKGRCRPRSRPPPAPPRPRPAAARPCASDWMSKSSNCGWIADGRRQRGDQQRRHAEERRDGGAWRGAAARPGPTLRQPARRSRRSCP